MSSIHSRVAKHMAQFDPSHDMNHVDRVVRLANILARKVAETQAVDLQVVEVAALLHDVNDHKYQSQLTDGESVMMQCLSDSGLSEDQQQLVLKIASNMSYSTEKKLRKNGEWGQWHDSCVELHLVQDADRLDAIGAVGILRVAAFSGAKNRPLVLTTNDEGDDAMMHFDEKLLHLHKTMKTAPGKTLAEQRTKIMTELVRQMYDEVTLADLGDESEEMEELGQLMKLRWFK
ncbi:hypothetical protein CJU90_1173 [Yarrowia sp. C11]|nr:hypothetical protein CKK34_2586 [Yarrowia sp. E02]KAG5373469.1 hypothetical protein CJU90_1173 [Yarrowia sp. C11]